MNIKNYKQDFISIGVTIILSIIIIFSSGLIFDSGFLSDKLNKGVEYYQGEVKTIVKENLQDDKYIEDIKLGYQNVTIEILDGPYKGNEYNITNNVSRLYNFKVKEGSKIIAGMYFMDNTLKDITIIGYKRSTILGVLIILFFIAILAVGGFKGLKSIISLIFTMICIIFLMLPLMIRGINPILSAIIIAIISITATLILVSGLNKKSLAAILGTLFGVLIAGGLAYSFGHMSNLSGINMEEAESIMYIAETTGLKINGIMFAGILVASLGAVMDVAMSISSSIFEIDSINKGMDLKTLFNSGMNIGRDIIGTMSNTLILAFAGGSLNTLILIYSSNMTSNRLLNLDVLGTEVIQGVAGSIGIILTVPITAIISAYLCKKYIKTSSL